MPEFEFNGKIYNNTVELSIEIVGGKYKMPILWRLKDTTLRYGELKKTLGKITHKMLSEQLKELEGDDLISRKVFAQVPPKVEYSITDKGRTAIPIIEILRKWGEDFKNGQL